MIFLAGLLGLELVPPPPPLNAANSASKSLSPSSSLSTCPTPVSKSDGISNKPY